MASVFQFTQGSESRVRPNDSSPLLGRFRAVPPRPGLSQRRSSNLGVGLLSDRLLGSEGGRGSVHVGYGALVAAQIAGVDDDYDQDDYDDAPSRLWRGWVMDLWVNPQQGPVKKMVDRWWSRYGLLVFVPAVLAVAWCAIPFPQYPLPRNGGGNGGEDKTPGHGAARVQVNFWFFLFVYYGLYNVVALIWITKVFNLYSLNWWPSSLGFPLTVSLIAVLSVAAPIPVYLVPEARWLTVHNTAWISWTFVVMATPVAMAFLILTANERHIGLRHSLSETQRIFTTSWWTGEPEPLPPGQGRRRNNLNQDLLGNDLDPATDGLLGSGAAGRTPATPSRRGMGAAAAGRSVALRKRWLPASFVRFLWFCVALFVGLLVYLIGEAYAEIYLRTLPHTSFETVVYVYGWIITVHLLDALTGWVLGIREGERVGSYPLSWVFKL